MSIHPTAIVDPNAQIAPDVTIGAYSVIGPDVEIGDGTWIGPHVVINGPTKIGRENRIFQFASIGEIPQDKKYRNERTRLEIGDRNVIREGCTINRGTLQDQSLTRIGNDNWIMAYVHVAHDCIVGNNTTMSNNVALAGHVTVGDYATLGGFTLVHQFVSIGAHSFTGMGTGVGKDVPPYVMVAGNPAAPHGINSEGLKRRGFTAEQLTSLRRAYKLLYRSGKTLEEAMAELTPMAEGAPEVVPLVQFLTTQTRGIVR
ncbi:MAG TPA: acyl-ACP--UDP-N-acetylglucosamine O-acyltransferase [Gammaproteobacteria bacterium]